MPSGSGDSGNEIGNEIGSGNFGAGVDNGDLTSTTSSTSTSKSTATQVAPTPTSIASLGWTTHSKQQCVLHPECSAGQRLVGASGIARGNCVECDNNTYQDAFFHRHRHCIPQPYCGLGQKSTNYYQDKETESMVEFTDETSHKRSCQPCEPTSFQPNDWHRLTQCIPQPFCGPGEFAVIRNKNLQSVQALQCVACPIGKYNVAPEHRINQCTAFQTCDASRGYALQHNSAIAAGGCVMKIFAVAAFTRTGTNGEIHGKLQGNITQNFFINKPVAIAGVQLVNVSNFTGEISNVRFMIKGRGGLSLPAGFFVDTETGAITAVPEVPKEGQFIEMDNNEGSSVDGEYGSGHIPSEATNVATTAAVAITDTPPAMDASIMTSGSGDSGSEIGSKIGSEISSGSVGAGDENGGERLSRRDSHPQPPKEAWKFDIELIAIDEAQHQALVEIIPVRLTVRPTFAVVPEVWEEEVFATNVTYFENYRAQYPIATRTSGDVLCDSNAEEHFGMCEVKLLGPNKKRHDLFTNFGLSVQQKEEEVDDVSYALRFERIKGGELGSGDVGESAAQTKLTVGEDSPGEWYVNRATGASIAIISNRGNYIGTYYAFDAASKTEVILKTWEFEVLYRDVDVPTYGPNQKPCGNGGTPTDSSKIFDQTYTCTCRPHYLGENCNVVDNSAAKAAAKTSASVGGAAGGVILLICLGFAANKYMAHRMAYRKFDFQREIQRLVDSGEIDEEQSNSEDTPREIPRRCVTITIKLGSGAFGDVCKAILDEGGMPAYPVAVKTVRDNGGEAAAELFREAAMMQQVAGANTGHPNLVSIIGVVTKGLPLYLVLSLCDKGSLLTVLAEDVKPNWEIRMKLLLGTAKGMDHLAQKRFVHRDLAARNVLVDSAMTAKVVSNSLALFPLLLKV
jgi:hypothetical protein